MANRFFPNYPKYIITSPFGQRIHPVSGVKKMHNGIDLVATADGKTGQIDKIKAHTGGVVDGVGFDNSAGNYVKIRVSLDTVMVYYHLRDRCSLAVGDMVKAGQIIGAMGKTGSATGAHLHFGIKKDGKWIDPAPYLDKDYPTDSGKTEAAATSSKKATDYAQGFLDSLSGTYKVTASALNVRNGAGTSKKIMVTIPKGTTVKCYGYYTSVLGVKWLYVNFTYKNVIYTGFASSKYLKK